MLAITNHVNDVAANCTHAKMGIATVIGRDPSEDEKKKKTTKM